jgi:hypothetical protein
MNLKLQSYNKINDVICKHASETEIRIYNFEPFMLCIFEIFISKTGLFEL